MIQRLHRPLATWNGRRWEASSIIVGDDRDCGGGPVGLMPKHVIHGRALGDMERNRPPDLSQYRRLSR